MLGKEPINLVEIDSSDDEGGGGVKQKNRSLNELMTSSATPLAQGSVPAISAKDSDYCKQKLDHRSFWKAGDYDVGPSKFVPVQGELEHARVHPKFLHSNATSHKWAFGAIAELLDNAIDEICNGATFVKVDKILNPKDNSPALLFLDDGGGMDPDCMRKCMSLGYSSKKSNTTIGQYGNGFKTSTMRLGADVIVFSRSARSGRETQSVGLLSYTFLRQTGQDDVIVPMVDFDVSNHWAEPIIYSSHDDWTANLKTILEWSPFETKEELMAQFTSIGSHGTKVVVYNLWLNDEGVYELSFDDDDEDIRLRDEANRSSKLNKRTMELQSHISYRIRYSLRAYTSILYLREFKNFKIILRGKPVEQFNILNELIYQQVVTYKPHLSTTAEEAPVKTTLGFIKEAPELNVSGFNVYHKNRLIRPFWKVTADGSSKGNGVVGVLETNFIEPAHDKQDFERSSLFIRLETRLKQMVMDYWKGHCHLIGYQPIGARKEQPSLKIQKQEHTIQHTIGSSVGHVERRLHSSQPNIRAATSRHELCSIEAQDGIVNHTMNSSAVQSMGGLALDSCADVSENGSANISVDQICEENIQLFMRCERHLQKENELKQTISKLEKDLEETKRKSAQLAAHLQNRKNQNILLQQMGNV